MWDDLDPQRRPQLSRTVPLLSWLLQGAAIISALAMGIWSQWGLDHTLLPVWWVTLLGGAAVFAQLLRRQALERREAPAGTVARPDLVLVVLAIVLGALAFPGFAGNRFSPLPTVAWLVSLVVLYNAFSTQDAPQERRRDCLAGGLHIPWHGVALIGIVLAGGLLRFYQLDAIPREMGVDMPVAYDNALDIMNGRFMIFAPRWPGNEALFFYLVAAYGRIFGLSHFAIKFASALVGLATIPALYGVARYLFNRNVALVAAALLAVSKWHVILSRTGYRLILVPLFVAGLIYLVARALREGRAADWVLAGMLLGLGMYTYNAFMVVPPTLAAALAVGLWLRRPRPLQRYGWGLAGLGLGALGVFLPLGRYIMEAPRLYLLRAASRVTSQEVPLSHDLPGTLAGNLWRSLGMFNARGEEGWYTNVPYERQLGMISAALLVCGLAYALVRWRKGHNATILILLAGMTLPSALSLAFPREVPSAGRGAGLIVPAYLLAALPLPLAARRLGALWQTMLQALPPQRALPGRRPLHAYVASTGALVVGLALSGVELGETWQAYFHDYVQHQPHANYAISLELAHMLDEYAAEGPAYVKPVRDWYDHDAVRTQLHLQPQTSDWEVRELQPGRPPLSSLKAPALFLLHPADGAALQTLRTAFPQGAAVNHRDDQGQVAFVAFYTNGPRKGYEGPEAAGTPSAHTPS